MNYVLMIYGDERGGPELDSPAWQEQLAAFGCACVALVAAGVLEGGKALQRSHAATTLRVRNGRQMITDGPFAETKEQLLGFYLLDCADLDEALAHAATLPGASTGSIEIRPVLPVM